MQTAINVFPVIVRKKGTHTQTKRSNRNNNEKRIHTSEQSKDSGLRRKSDDKIKTGRVRQVKTIQ